jgi:CPA1 family monovalent cation:H+ antiporter
MDIIDIITILITLSAVFSYLNHRYIRFPRTIGLMFFALVLSLVLIGVGHFGWGIKESALEIIAPIDFNRVLLHGMLGFLLFAGALQVNIDDLAQEKWVVLSLATIGVALSTLIVGILTWGLLVLLRIPIPFIFCLLFGALISPTDPIAVLAIIKAVGAPKKLEVQISGEALFNDGVGVVIFIVLLRIAAGGQGLSQGEIALLFAEEALGGILFGLTVGFIAYRMLKNVDNYQVEILITLALTMGGYSLANALGTSGPLAIVAAGLLIGNRGRALAMSAVTREHLDHFWELVDEILNAVLFVLIGLEVLTLEFVPRQLLAGLVVIPLVLLARLASVGIPILFLKLRFSFLPNTVKILTWGGLRGGIAVALALSHPPGPARDVIVTITYMVVVFSILVQGLTMERLMKGWKGGKEEGEES